MIPTPLRRDGRCSTTGSRCTRPSISTVRRRGKCPARTRRYGLRMDPEVRQLRALLAVVDTGTFTGAADVLGVSQASVSRTVAALERTLGTRVLHRTTREVSLTAVGARVVGHARRVVEEVAAVRRAAQQGRGELRIGYTWSALGRHTTAVQRRWSDTHPGSTLVFVQSNTPTAGLTEGVADASVLRRPVGDPRVRTALLGAERRWAALASDDPLARRRSEVVAPAGARRSAGGTLRRGAEGRPRAPGCGSPPGPRRPAGAGAARL